MTMKYQEPTISLINLVMVHRHTQVVVFFNNIRGICTTSGCHMNMGERHSLVVSWSKANTHNLVVALPHGHVPETPSCCHIDAWSEELTQHLVGAETPSGCCYVAQQHNRYILWLLLGHICMILGLTPFGCCFATWSEAHTHHLVVTLLHSPGTDIFWLLLFCMVKAHTHDLVVALSHGPGTDIIWLLLYCMVIGQRHNLVLASLHSHKTGTPSGYHIVTWSEIQSSCFAL